MSTIGVIGGEIIPPLIKTLFTNAGDDCHFDLAIPDTGITDQAFDIVVVNGDKGLSSKLSSLKLTEETIFIVNADCKTLQGRIGRLVRSIGCRIITYGFNPKSCVTASSVSCDDSGALQYCIQRSIPTFSGEFLDEQEFSVDIGTSEQASAVHVGSVLAAVTAALVAGIGVERIRGAAI